MKSVSLSTGAVKIDYYGSRITKEIVASSTLHFVLVILLMFAPPLLIQKNEPTITEITIVDNLEPIPFPVIRSEPSAPAGLLRLRQSGYQREAVSRQQGRGL